MSASPEMHHQHQQQLQQEANGAAPLQGELKSASAEGTPPPELATMTTVSVLDLHKDYNGGAGVSPGGAATGSVTSPHTIVHDGATDMSLPDDGTTEKVYDKETNTVYVYTTAAGATGHKLAANAHHHQLTTIVHGQQQQQQMHSPDQLHPSEHHAVAEQNLLHARLIQQQQQQQSSDEQQQHLQRMSPVDQHQQQHHQQHPQVHPDDGSIIDGHRLLPATISGNDAGDPQQQQQHHQHPHLGRMSPEEHQGGVRLLEDSHIQRLLGNQEIISRDIINGEHHIITRNENGETILTRIAISTADQLLNRMDNSIIYTTTSGGGGAGGAVGVGPQEQLPTTVLQYEKDVEDKHQQHHGHPHAAPHTHQPQTIYTTAAGGPAPDQTQTKQIVYTLGGGEPKNVIYGDPKAAMPHFETVPGAGGGGGGGSAASGPGGSGEEDKPQIDYVYNEGNKTVIYTDQKGLESLYANNELGLIDGTQIVVQGNLQYTQQQGPDGTTVYVVSSDMNPEDISGLQQR
uniref:Uncharacterized protein n=1 Tax=Anopheles stephensi TaxID=30069 RepID=A0A182Y135_ANOST